MAAGSGSRVAGEGVPKALLTVGGRAVISRILGAFPEDIPVVMAVSRDAAMLQGYMRMAHPGRDVLYVIVDNPDGPGSGPGTSLLACREALDTPFVLVTCDTLVDEAIPSPTTDWIAVAPHAHLERYDSVETDEDDRVVRWDRRVVRQDNRAWIGLAGIHRVGVYFDGLRRASLGPSGERDLIGGFEALVEGGLRAIPFTWHDTGNPSDLAQTRETAPCPFRVLDKTEEAIWFEGDRVVRWFADATIARNRVRRADDLHGLVPEMLGHDRGLYAYRFVEGDLLGDVLTGDRVGRLLEFCERDLWEDRTDVMDAVDFRRLCREFYFDKTAMRLQSFYAKHPGLAGGILLNDRPLRPVADLLGRLNWDWLSDGIPVRIHGDLHTDNILLVDQGAEERFVLLDWRQDFAGEIRLGDLYYDLAKLLHYFQVHTRAVDEGRFSVERNGSVTWIDHEVPPVLDEGRRILEDYVNSRGLDWEKVQTLSALVFLNMASLHAPEEGAFFFLLGWSALEEIIGRQSSSGAGSPVVCSGELDPVVIVP